MNNNEFINSWFDCKVKNREIRHHRYCHLYADDEAVYSYSNHFPLAIPCESGFLLNGDRYSSTTSCHQSLTRSACARVCGDNNLKFAVVPFTVLNNADLTPIRHIEIIDKTRERHRNIKYTDKNGKTKVRQEHLLGGSVIRHSGRYFLSSTDPTSTWGNGYFLTELVESVTTVEDAFESLKPSFVKQLKSELEGSEAPMDLILRQGEWFFVKMDEESFVKPVKLLKGIKNMEKMSMRNEHLPSADSTQPHHKATRLIYVGNGEGSYFDEKEQRHVSYRIASGFYCRGTIRHDNREHRMLKLGNGREWYLAIQNRQVRSWSYGGRVD